jgi:hypothetical protein
MSGSFEEDLTASVYVCDGIAQSLPVREGYILRPRPDNPPLCTSKQLLPLNSVPLSNSARSVSSVIYQHAESPISALPTLVNNPLLQCKGTNYDVTRWMSQVDEITSFDVIGYRMKAITFAPHRRTRNAVWRPKFTRAPVISTVLRSSERVDDSMHGKREG